MSTSARLLPDFERPPIAETLLGVQFAGLERFSLAHVGLYWRKIRADYPGYQSLPPLPHAVEEFEPRVPIGGGRPPAGYLELAAEPTVRSWFLNASRTRLLQVQKDHFIRNWRKVAGNEAYERYDELKPSFRVEWERFCRFLEEEGLGTPDVNQCEVTYVNHIDVGQGWQPHGEIRRIAASWSGAYSGTFLPDPETVRVNASYLMPDKKGRLHIHMQPAIRTRDAAEVLQLNLTARGRPNSSRVEDILGWFDLGHEWIVRGFTDFTTPEMHKVWGRTV